MILNASEFLDRVNRATVAAMQVLAVDASEIGAVDYILLDSAIAREIKSAYLEVVQIKECFQPPNIANAEGGPHRRAFKPY